MANKSQNKVWGFTNDSLLVRHVMPGAPKKGKTAEVQVRSSAKGQTRTVDLGETVRIELFPLANDAKEKDPRLKVPPEVRIRNAVGESVAQLEKLNVSWVEYDFDLKDEPLQAALNGLELGLYRFKRVFKNEMSPLRFGLKAKRKSLPSAKVEAWVTPAIATNLARHLVNLAPNLLNPVQYAGAVPHIFSGLSGVQVEIWDEKRLQKEGMHLHLAVGQGSDAPPRLVHIRYRPRTASKKVPIALVGKGITFDSGGLDVKPASGMRLMKKDMGGSAAVLATAFAVARQKLPVALDAYLALAENAIDAHSFRPSDVLVSRNGLSVEIHNTDAEGRLVLADALDVAVTQKEKPRYVVDVATLTGAIKVGLGAELAGLFANDVRLMAALNEAGRAAGDLNWPMPLMQKYRGSLNSNFADMVNASDGFGGAITAALFLESFVRDVPWAHLDIYGWKDSSEGAISESGGSGQAVLALLAWLARVK